MNKVTHDTNRCQRLWPESTGHDLRPKLMEECIKRLTSRKYSSSTIQEIIVLDNKVKIKVWNEKENYTIYSDFLFRKF
jgi:hypothetical protein